MNAQSDSQKPIHILLVDDHHLVRAGLRTLLETCPGCEVIAEATNGREAVGFLRTQPPDVVIMDIRMPELNGLEATRQVREACPSVRVLILSMYAHEDYVLQAWHNGATGYVLKDAIASELEQAVRAVARGHIYLSPAVLTPVLSAYLQPRTRGARQQEESTSWPPPALSPPEAGNSPAHCRERHDKRDCAPATPECKDSRDAPGTTDGAAQYPHPRGVGAVCRADRAG